MRGLLSYLPQQAACKSAVLLLPSWRCWGSLERAVQARPRKHTECRPLHFLLRLLRIKRPSFADVFPAQLLTIGKCCATTARTGNCLRGDRQQIEVYVPTSSGCMSTHSGSSSGTCYEGQRC